MQFSINCTNRLIINQIPLKLGFLLSINAWMPSFAPFLLKSDWKIVASWSRPWSKVVSKATFTALLAAIKAYEDLLAIVFTISFIFSSKFYVGSRWAIFNLWASFASIGSPVIIILFATFYPTIRGRIWVPPRPGMIPRVIYGRANLAFSEHKIISVSKAS